LHQRDRRRGNSLKAVLFAAFIFGSACGGQEPRAGTRLGINERARCTITRISDGDSVVCSPLGRVRLLLIDAPELADGKIGRQSRQALSVIMPVGTQVIAETDVRVIDQFGRVLAYLFLPSGAMVNEKMAQSGYATTLVYQPNVKYVERIRAAVVGARKEKRGLWAEGGFDCAPRDYRAGRCR
jgi:endonuclease YncB( thermonuclease family)